MNRRSVCIFQKQGSGVHNVNVVSLSLWMNYFEDNAIKECCYL